MSHASETPNRQRPLVAAIVGTVVIMAYALFAAVQILVLNPLAAVPGASLRDIYAHVAEAGESMGVLVVLASLAVGPGIAIALLVAVWSGPATSVRRVALQYLAVVALGALGYFWASFGPGMALADSYFISGGDHSQWATPLYVASGLALVAMLLYGIAASPRRRSGGIPRATLS